MLFRLAFKSFRRQVRSYLIYFLSMILAVTIFYTFSALTYNDAIIVRANQDIHLSQVLVLGQIAVIGILLFFMLSTNRFFLRRRAEEIGIYHLFGLNRWKITGLFISEIIILGILSLGIGIVIGIVFSKMFSMILVKAMALSIESSFFISWRSVGLTAGTMFFILLIVAMRTAWILQDYSTHQLFKMDQLTSQQLEMRGWQKVLGAISVLFLLLSYLGAFQTLALGRWLANFFDGSGFYANFLGILITLFLASVGTIFFFIWGLRWLLWLVGRSRKITEQNLTGLLIGNLRARLTRNRRTTAGITATMSIAIILISLAFSTFMISLREVYYTDPTDFQVAADQYPRLKDIVEENDGAVTAEETLNFKTVGGYLTGNLVNNQGSSAVELVDVISLSNYQEYQEVNQGLPNIKLKNSQQVVLLDTVQNLFSYIFEYDSRAYLGNQPVTIQRATADRLGLTLLRYGYVTFVVSDELFDQLEGYSYQIAAFNTNNQNLEALVQAVSENLPVAYDYALSYDLNWNGSAVVGEIASGNQGPSMVQRLNYSSQYPNWRLTRRQSGLVIYVTVFIGLIALITTGSIIALRQIAEAEHGKENYQLLHLLGIPKRKILRVMYWENALVFIPITSVIVLNSFFGIYLLSRYLTFTNFWLPNIFIIFTVVVYLMFYILTANFYRRVVDL
ncbi:FtsX-like permease family protein [Enterococcus sp. LJL90]